ncbi:DUF1062 domain-containing protein [Citrobacter portucalensis]|uniref:DUF1062 domain-containing protein n=1 Tax=Citrobacter portucalensis TaxID=1639133 RepID=UPI00019B0DEE|nr:DUF1062 domain-containing protein [Citrobacter portucalensis]MBJ9829907.1 DUF1062 domain-containing protein [Citrobacter freundii]EEH93832.1 hypothetical protein CSAG_02186 [Citrobacter portucalensis]MDE9686874.1 DUF1062 domain-containing protein [Citrobacter portucalensis]QMN71403.1 DUF1062 domain-containing protein [Citrobacter freundii]RHH49379.1 DUF1062 domain-containing protein [Citrobacter portucalensis]
MKVTWTVTPVGYQRIAKPCPSCNVKREFAPSGAFRVNSQKKVLDIWSIYKCIHCEYTWNISLFSRLHVSKINRELYHRFITNDASTVHYFANDKATLNRNNAELAGKPDFRIQEQWQVSINSGQNVTVSIRLSHSFQINVLSILKRQLLLSTAEIKKLIDEGHIRGVTMKELKSRKLMTRQLDFKLSVVILCAQRKVVLSQR